MAQHYVSHQGLEPGDNSDWSQQTKENVCTINKVDTTVYLETFHGSGAVNLETFRGGQQQAQLQGSSPTQTEQHTAVTRRLDPNYSSVGDFQHDGRNICITGNGSSNSRDRVNRCTAAVHRLKLKPPTYDGNYSTFEEWNYRFTAYMGIQDPTYPLLMDRAEKATTVLAESDLRTAAGSTQEAESWIQLSTNLKYILVSMKSGFAATAVRQHQQEIALEVYKQLCVRFSTPLWTRSIGYLTKLLKPTFDHNNFEEAFSNWEFELQRYEAANTTRLPDPVKIAALMNETKGPLQQHLHLNAGGSPAYAQIRATIMEYYRTTMAFTRLQQHSSAVTLVAVQHQWT